MHLVLQDIFYQKKRVGKDEEGHEVLIHEVSIPRRPKDRDVDSFMKHIENNENVLYKAIDVD